MKKLLLILFLIISVAGCSNKEEVPETSKDKESAESNTNNGDSQINDEERIYQIGESADITTDSGMPYQVTVNSFDITSGSVDGVRLEDYNASAEDGDQFAVVNVTIKNTSDSAFVPKDRISGSLYDGETPQFSAVEETFKERFEELGSGEEITGDLVFYSDFFDWFDVLHLVYEAESLDNETRFELPMP